jgi:single-strand DNA-binding protein
MYAKLILVGNLGGDAELRYTKDGKPVLSWSLATDYGWGDNQRTIWYRCSLWGDRAEKLKPYLLKGKALLVEGILTEPQPWQGKDGEWRASLDLTAYTVKFVGGRDDAPRDGASAPNAGAVEPIGTVGDDEVPF